MGFDPANSIHSGEGVENIPLSPNWRVKETDLENWIEIFMKKIGRNTRFSRPLIDPEDLPKQPEPRPWDSIVTRWSYLTLGDEDSPDYPNAPGVKFRAAVNVITDNIAHENTISGGNSYFAAIAMLIYGNANLWSLIRAQHLHYFVEVLADDDHPRNLLYRRINMERTGKCGLELIERLCLTDCWVNHTYIQQITADLYGIFLVIFQVPFGTSFTTAVSCRGNYDAPHRLLLFRNVTEYNPLVPQVDSPSEYRFPEITFKGTKGLVGVPIEGDPESNDGLLHPWRTPLQDEPVPEKLDATPIEVIGPPTNMLWEKVLWVNIRAQPGDEMSRAEKMEFNKAQKIVEQTIKKHQESEVSAQTTPSTDSDPRCGQDGVWEANGFQEVNDVQEADKAPYNFEAQADVVARGSNEVQQHNKVEVDDEALEDNAVEGDVKVQELFKRQDDIEERVNIVICEDVKLQNDNKLQDNIEMPEVAQAQEDALEQDEVEVEDEIKSQDNYKVQADLDMLHDPTSSKKPKLNINTTAADLPELSPTRKTPLTPDETKELKAAVGPLRTIGDVTSTAVENFFEEAETEDLYYETIITTHKQIITSVKPDCTKYSDYNTLEKRSRNDFSVSPPATRDSSSPEPETPIRPNWTSKGRDMSMKLIREECIRRNIEVPSRMRAPEVKRIFGQKLADMDAQGKSHRGSIRKRKGEKEETLETKKPTKRRKVAKKTRQRFEDRFPNLDKEISDFEEKVKEYVRANGMENEVADVVHQISTDLESDGDIATEDEKDSAERNLRIRAGKQPAQEENL